MREDSLYIWRFIFMGKGCWRGNIFQWKVYSIWKKYRSSKIGIQLGKGLDYGPAWEFLAMVRECRPVPQILSLFQTKNCHFSHPFSDLTSKLHNHSWVWPLRNYICHHNLDLNSNKRDFCLNAVKKTFFLDNGVMTTPKRRMLSFVFTVLCLKKSLLIRITTYPVEKQLGPSFSELYWVVFTRKRENLGGWRTVTNFFSQKLENNDILFSGFITY